MEFLIKQYLRFYRASFFSRLASGFAVHFIKLWKGSLLYQILCGTGDYQKFFESSVSGRVLLKLSGGLSDVGKYTRVYVEQSFIASAVRDFFGSLMAIPLSAYGEMVFVFAFVESIGSAVLGGGGLPLYASSGILALGLLCSFVKISVARIYNNSLLLRFAGGYFGLEELPEEKKPYSLALWRIIGLLAGLMSVFLPLNLFIMAFGGLLGSLFIFCHIYAGVWLTVFCLPLLPTKYILGLCLVCCLSFLGRVVLTGGQKLRFEIIDFFVLIFSVLLAYSTFISYIPSNSAVTAATYILFIAFYFVVKNTVDTKKKLYALISAIVAAGLLVSLFGLYQKLTGASFAMTEAWIDSEMFEETSARIYSTLDNPNVLGEYLLFIIPLSFAGVYYFKSYIYKFASVCVLALAALCMVFTLSRGAWLGLIFAVMLYTLIKDRRLIWLGIIALPFVPLLAPDSIVERFLSIGNLQDSSSSYRLNIWMASLSMVKDFWPIGIGLGTAVFTFIYQKFAFTAVYAPHSHNLFLQVIIDLGFMGLLILLCILFLFFRGLLSGSAHSRDSFLTSAGAALCAGMGGYLLQGLTDNVWYNYRVVAFFWVMIALAALFRKHMRAGRAEKESALLAYATEEEGHE